MVSGAALLEDAVDAPRESISSRLSLIAHPNPFRRSMTFTYDVPRRASSRLRIYDVAGRLVRDLGPSKRQWDGLSDEGSSVAGGTYFARLTVGGETLTRKIIRLRGD
jgi:hypothetical protein